MTDPMFTIGEDCYVQSNAAIRTAAEVGWTKHADSTFTVYRTNRVVSGTDYWAVIESQINDEGDAEFVRGAAGLGPSGAIDAFLGDTKRVSTPEEFVELRDVLYALEADKSW